MTAAFLLRFPQRLGALGPFFAVFLAVADAEASPPREVVVSLEDGTTARGRLAEIVPGTRCVIVVASGERRTIPWASVQRIDDASAPEAQAQAPAPATTLAREEAPAASPPPSGRTTVVSLDASSSVELQRDTGDGTWVPACRAPCELALPVDASYRLVEDGRPISPVRLAPNGAPRVVLDVSLARPGLRAFGGILTGVGGLALLAALSVESDRDYSNDDSTTPFALLGVIALAVGIPLLATSHGSDRVVQRAAGSPRSAPAATRDFLPRRQTVGPTLGSPRTASILTLQF